MHATPRRPLPQLSGLAAPAARLAARVTPVASLRFAALGIALALAALAVAALAAAGCSDDPTTAGGNLGIAGASCVRTPDCRAPLQCLDQVCRDPAAEAPDATATDATATDATTPDATALDGDAGATDAAADTLTGYDVSDWEFLVDTATPDVAEVTGEVFSPFEDCGELGIASAWAGTFVGAIDFDVTPNPLTPSTGTLVVEGSLAFDITCIESKFVVRGTMRGVATVDGQPGAFPFELDIIGTYDPETGTMNANMVDGAVSIYGLIEVYFEGEFDGAVVDDVFQGTWSGASTGTNQTFITGTAEGDGFWGAEPE